MAEDFSKTDEVPRGDNLVGNVRGLVDGASKTTTERQKEEEAGKEGAEVHGSGSAAAAAELDEIGDNLGDRGENNIENGIAAEESVQPGAVQTFVESSSTGNKRPPNELLGNQAKRQRRESGSSKASTTIGLGGRPKRGVFFLESVPQRAEQQGQSLEDGIVPEYYFQLKLGDDTESGVVNFVGRASWAALGLCGQCETNSEELSALVQKLHTSAVEWYDEQSKSLFFDANNCPYDSSIHLGRNVTIVDDGQAFHGICCGITEESETDDVWVRCKNFEKQRQRSKRTGKMVQADCGDSNFYHWSHVAVGTAQINYPTKPSASQQIFYDDLTCCKPFTRVKAVSGEEGYLEYIDEKHKKVVFIDSTSFQVRTCLFWNVSQIGEYEAPQKPPRTGFKVTGGSSSSTEGSEILVEQTAPTVSPRKAANALKNAATDSKKSLKLKSMAQPSGSTTGNSEQSYVVTESVFRKLVASLVTESAGKVASALYERVHNDNCQTGAKVQMMRESTDNLCAALKSQIQTSSSEARAFSSKHNQSVCSLNRLSSKLMDTLNILTGSQDGTNSGGIIGGLQEQLLQLRDIGRGLPRETSTPFPMGQQQQQQSGAIEPNPNTPLNLGRTQRDVGGELEEAFHRSAEAEYTDETVVEVWPNWNEVAATYSFNLAATTPTPYGSFVTGEGATAILPRTLAEEPEGSFYIPFSQSTQSIRCTWDVVFGEKELKELDRYALSDVTRTAGLIYWSDVKRFAQSGCKQIILCREVSADMATAKGGRCETIIDRNPEPVQSCLRFLHTRLAFCSSESVLAALGSVCSAVMTDLRKGKNRQSKRNNERDSVTSTASTTSSKAPNNRPSELLPPLASDVTNETKRKKNKKSGEESEGATAEQSSSSSTVQIPMRQLKIKNMLMTGRNSIFTDKVVMHYLPEITTHIDASTPKQEWPKIPRAILIDCQGLHSYRAMEGEDVPVVAIEQGGGSQFE